jgi:isopentenyl diphosphate isomerase/L-lactate dehydrogenase-like FMN-dependent dehydrogenase
VNGAAEVYVDGGIRRGSEVVKALALGARAVFIGRPVLWGLAVAGERGVRRVLDLLGEEVALSLALAGCPDLRSVDRSLVVPCA